MGPFGDAYAQIQPDQKAHTAQSAKHFVTVNRALTPQRIFNRQAIQMGVKNFFVLPTSMDKTLATLTPSDPKET